MDTFTITQPDDWHVHLRDDSKLARTVADTCKQFARAIIMPNLTPPITTIAAAEQYRKRILQLIPSDNTFTPLMTLYLTDDMTTDIIEAIANHPDIYAIKLYPAGATTNSAAGITDITQLYPIFAAMQQHSIPLLIHGEVTHGDIFEREAVFIEQNLIPLRSAFPELKIVLEHITTSNAVNYVLSEDNYIAATITPQHLMFDRNILLAGGIKPDYYCLPILKTNEDKQSLLAAAISGNPKFFLGTDSAPHSTSAKYSACGCAGIYSAHNAIELYAEIFSNANALDKLEGFASFYGADFYGLPRNQTSITLKNKQHVVPTVLDFGDEKITPLLAGKNLQWSLDIDH